MMTMLFHVSKFIIVSSSIKKKVAIFDLVSLKVLLSCVQL